MRIQISYADETQRVWETQGVPAGRESVPTAYGVKWDLRLQPLRDGRVALVLETTASSAKGAEPPGESPAEGEVRKDPAGRNSTARQVAASQAKDGRATDTDVQLLAVPNRKGGNFRTVSALLDAVEERGGVSRMVIDGEVVYPPMDDGIE